MFKGMHSGLTSHGGKIIQKIVEGLSTLEIVQQSLKRHTGSAENRSAPQHVRISGDYVARGGHSAVSSKLVSGLSLLHHRGIKSCCGMDRRLRLVKVLELDPNIRSPATNRSRRISAGHSYPVTNHVCSLRSRVRVGYTRELSPLSGGISYARSHP